VERLFKVISEILQNLERCMVTIAHNCEAAYDLANALILKTVDYYADVSILCTVNHKKRDILFLTITLASLNRFL